MPTDEPLASPYRIMRRVEAPADSPWPGLLVAAPGQGSLLLVEADLLPDDWAGWTAQTSGHVLGPIDIVRRESGHAAAMPVCAERVADFLVRRSATPLSDGERLTLAVSLVRGTQELAAAGRADCPGTWWLTDAGRPMFAAHSGGQELSMASATIVRDLAADARPRMAEALDELHTAVSEPESVTRRLARLEEQLFAIAEPEPLATAVLAPRRAREFGAAAMDDTVRTASPHGAFIDTVSRHVDADLADLVSRITTGVWRRVRRPAPAGRRRRVVIPLGIAAVVLAVGLLWPTGGSDAPAVAQPPAPSGTSAQTEIAPTPDAAATATSPSAAAVGDTDLAGVASRLLTQRSRCEGDAGCLAQVLEDPAGAIPAGAADLPAGQRSMTLLDDFGGAAVLRVEAIAPRRGAQLVVLVRSDERWLLRDVHDITEQP